MAKDVASFAAGCFWGVEARFRALPGVADAPVGYMGGHIDEPTYRQVCGGATGHAEAVQVTFDPERISYAELMSAFFDIHNPTTLNRQGPDRGTQYRSAIYYHDEDQKKQAEAKIAQIDATGDLSNPVVTEVAPAGMFWRAEEYHQRYLEKNDSAFCHI